MRPRHTLLAGLGFTTLIALGATTTAPHAAHTPATGRVTVDDTPPAPKPLRTAPGAPAWTHTCVGMTDDTNCPQGDQP